MSSSSSLSKRKIGDFSDDNLPPSINPTASRKDRHRSPSAADPPLQFFVRVLSDHTHVLHADPRDTVGSIHEKIHSITGIPLGEQRLIYRGKQLTWDQTLSECGVQNDAGLQLVGRLRSTYHHRSWRLVNKVVDLVIRLCGICHASPPPNILPFPQKALNAALLEFLTSTPRVDPHLASGHLQVFTTLAAPAALVMLYMSSHEPNRKLARDAIWHFVTSCKSALPKHSFRQCVPIMLEFCTLLRRAVGDNDPLYALCRSNLGTMLEFLEFGVNKGPVGLRDVFPFVIELAAKISAYLAAMLSVDLVRGAESASLFTGPLRADVNDFSAFVGWMRNGIKGDSEFSGPIQVPPREELCRLQLCFANEINFLHSIFSDLLSITEKCMVNIEVHLKSGGGLLSVGYFLALLKELNSISKLYHGCEEVFWESMKQRKSALCYIITKSAKRSSDNSWISDCKEATNFEARRHLAMMCIPEVTDDYDDLHEMLIDRANLLPESYQYIRDADAKSLRAGLFMEFKNEEATGPGVLREWFLLVCQAIFNPQNALFVACPNDRRRFFPNPVPSVDPLNLKYYNFVGKMIALALMHKVQVGIVFDRVFFLQLCKRTITLEDIKDADPFLYNSCKQILEMDPEAVDQDALGLMFVHEIEELGTRRVVELCSGGKNVAVNSKNRRQYVQTLIHHRFVKETAEKVAQFTEGFTEIFSCEKLRRSFFRYLTPQDFDLMLHGSENEISVDDWKAHAEYKGFKETDVQISWFWKIVGDMTKEQKKVLLFFWTSIKYLPSEGFSGLASRLYIYKNGEASDRLPSSHTCFYRICFPAYPTMDAMRDRLRIITQEHVGCSFGTW